MSQQEATLSPAVAAVLADVDAFDWTAVSHAYGDASDMPSMLRALVVDAGDDSDSGSESVSDLWGAIVHQGTVYSASTASVPFLARLAAAGAATRECLWLLGWMAASDDTAPGAEDDIRNAVRAHADVLEPLASHDDGEIRKAAVHALGQTRSIDLFPALRAARDDDEDALVRAEAVIAMVRCGAPDTAGVVAAAYADPADAVRLAGVFASFDAGRPWTRETKEALLSVPDPDSIAGQLLDDRHEALAWVVEQLCDSGHGEAAASLLIEAAEREHADLAVVLYAATIACERSRAATELLRPFAVKHVDAEGARMLTQTLGLTPGPEPLPLPVQATPDQLLGDDANLDVEEMRTRLAVPLPEYARLTTPVVDKKLALAAALWERTDDPAPVVAAVTEVTDRLAEREGFLWGYQRANAARTAARLGVEAAALELVLRALLDDPIALAAAATALARAGCDFDVDNVADRLAAQAGQYRGDDTVTALATLAPLLSPAAVQRWRNVIERDARFVTGGQLGTFVAADEQFRDALRDALAGADA
ncbi:HEAT repeat domain-containing protein [Myceligenerans pegani]|uniref:HEAT repeat domain-containing protein n=1 Tax=Myceligenerans pegani TaxID=2776917 RepID=A0ABR9MZ13_9MICO|nr:HEAT repeat domain-containing protein [Myceligenerans sp. TRM 65318]MBE1876631.1 HEAT repeat domain-containing protein [Myceligenerans sp. TRM 65318]MBE3018902.1 HEAT repeat domain-containing protein [Myceligenerans sp. TRM 65318]